jgi:hypothetical protein
MTHRVAKNLRPPENRCWLVAALAFCVIALYGCADRVEALNQQAAALGLGSFIPLGQTWPQRSGVTATLLPNGKVLFTGGYSGPWLPDWAGQKTTELYDPVTNSFDDGPKMSVLRSYPTAVLLANGKVLIAGGDNLNELFSSEHPSTSELYDPTTNTIGVGPPMQEPVSNARGLLLHDGRVLVIGRSMELYDPATNSFTVGPAPNVRAGDAVLLPDGKVLFVGGSYKKEDRTELYDPVTNKISFGPTMNTKRGYPVNATPLSNGKILIAGGAGTSTELYDPTRNSFIPGPSMNESVEPLMAVPLPSGRALLVGLATTSAPLWALADIRSELYDPMTGTFALGPLIPLTILAPDRMAGWQLTGTVLHSGNVLLEMNDSHGYSIVLYRP